MNDKTEQPTPRRLRKARAEGDNPVSHTLTAGVGFVLALLVVPAAAGAVAAHAAELVRRASLDVEPSVAARGLALEVLFLSAPVVGAATLGAVAAGLVQTGGRVGVARLGLRFDRLDPAEGFKNLFRSERLFALVRALVAAAVVAGIAWSLFRRRAADLAESAGNLAAVGTLIGELATKLAWASALLGLALGGLELLVAFRAWRERHRMSRDEIRREHREAEGDPEIKAKRRRAHQEALSGSMLNAVREATVVVMNPTHLASALRYREDEDEAPRVVAQGKGDFALRIVEAARAYGIPCVVDVPVARALSELEPGDEIPEALYEAVAEILRALAERPDEG